jgi:Anti-sigma-K factor rskA
MGRSGVLAGVRLSRDNDIDLDLAELLAGQERAIELMRRAAAEVEAPAALRARIEAMRRPRRRRRAAFVGAFATAAAVAAVVVSHDSGTSGERFHAALRPTGEATLTKTSSGWRIRLEAPRLPRRAGGRFYEAWLRNADGVEVPIGTFNEGTNVTLWAGVSPTKFKFLIVRTSSGEKVLAGTVGP